MHPGLLWVVVRLVVHLNVVEMRYFVAQMGYGCHLFGILSHLMKGMFLSQFGLDHPSLCLVNSTLHVLLG